MIILAIVIVAVAIFLWEKSIEAPSSIHEEQKVSANDSGSNPVRIIDDQNIEEVVEYKNGIFSPRAIKIDEKSNCLLAVINTGDKTLKLGLSPHDRKGDSGVSYTETPPGETILVDPRYRIESIAFHDHNHSGSELKVELEGICKDF